jgi:hypothetical protein
MPRDSCFGYVVAAAGFGAVLAGYCFIRSQVDSAVEAARQEIYSRSAAAGGGGSEDGCGG